VVGVLLVLEWHMQMSQCQRCDHYDPNTYIRYNPETDKQPFKRWNPATNSPFPRPKDEFTPFVCSAFPEGIPIIIFWGVNVDGRIEVFNHEEPYPGDNGIQYEKRRYRKRS
jgi:hypothetical protein